MDAAAARPRPGGSERAGLSPVAAAPALLALLAVASGCNDVVSYVSLGHVFTANMTGNTVLLGIALTAGDTAQIARSACALGGFCAGVALAAAFLLQEPSESVWPPRVTRALAAEALALVALAALAVTTGAAGSDAYWLIGIAGAAMGAQSAAVLHVGVRGVSTTYITGTLTRTLADAVARAVPNGHSARDAGPGSSVRLRIAVWLSYLAAALLAAAVTRWSRLQAAWLAAAVVALVAVLAAILADRRQSGPG